VQIQALVGLWVEKVLFVYIKKMGWSTSTFGGKEFLEGTKVTNKIKAEDKVTIPVDEELTVAGNNVVEAVSVVAGIAVEVADVVEPNF
jgi:hypothetical protein